MASTLSILARSGVQLVEALQITAQVTSNLCIRQAVEQAADMPWTLVEPCLGAVKVFPANDDSDDCQW